MCTLGLVTGNYEPVARLKLARAGIGKWFRSAPGGFGSDSEDRAALPPIARRRAGACPARAGDRDRRHAARHRVRRADGVRCVAVTTGQYRGRAAAGADAVATDARELRPALEELGA